MNRPNQPQRTNRPMPDDNNKVLFMLGEIKGELTGLREAVERDRQSANRRMDDMITTNQRRNDLVEQRLARLESNDRSMLLRTTSWGGLSGGLVAGMVEFLRVLKGG